VYRPRISRFRRPRKGAETLPRAWDARDIQRARDGGRGISTNAEAEGEMLDRVATPDTAGAKLLTDAASTMRLTAIIACCTWRVRLPTLPPRNRCSVPTSPKPCPTNGCRICSDAELFARHPVE